MSCAGPWTSFGAQASITQASNPAIGYGNGYHSFIQIAVTGAATVTYAACKDFFLSTSLASAVYPITLAQGGTGVSSFTAHGVLIGEGSSALSVVSPGTSGYGLVSNGAISDPTFQAIVNSFNTRTGAVVPATGDYTAAMVTNAVDTTQTYNNPVWLTGISATNCPTCVTTGTAQTITGAKTFNGGVYVGANEVIDANGFTAWGGATLNDSTALGYVVANVDHYFTDQDNESRGVSSVVRSTRTTVDQATNGWDQFGITGAVVLGAMNLPTDPIYGSAYIRGQQKAVASELYYQVPVAPYTANLGMNYLASLAQVAPGVTLNTWAGLLVAEPGFIGPNGGHVVNGYGIWIQNLQDPNSILTSANAAAIKVDGLGTFGRILWQSASAYVPTVGTLEFSGTVGVQTASGVGFKVGGSAANAGLAAGSFAIGSTTIIDGSLNISTTGYINTSNGFEISGVTAINSSRSGSFLDLMASGLTTLAGNLIVNVTGTTQCLHVNSSGIVSGTGADCGSGGGGGGGSGVFPGSVQANTSLANYGGFYVNNTGVIQYDSGSATISIGNIYNLTAAGDIVTSGTHHVGAGSSSPGGYYLGATQIITGSGNATFSALTATGALTTHITGSTQCLHVNSSGVVSGTGSDCGAGGGGPSFTGSVTANTGTTSGAGFFVNTTGIIQCDSTGCPTISVGNIYNLTATGDIVTSGAHHVGSGTNAGNGGYWLGSTQIIKGDGQITTNVTGSVQCLHVNTLGVVSGTGADCGTGGGGGTPGGTNGQIQYNSSGVFAGFTAGGDLTFSAPNFTLATVNSGPGACGDSTHVCAVTTNGKGLVTAQSAVAISNSFTGSVVANTSLTNTAGFYINTTGIIQYDSGSSTISIGNIYNLTAAGDIVTSGTHHVGAGSGTPGGYYLGSTQIITGSGNASFGTVGGSSATFTGSIISNSSLTNVAGYYIGTTGVIQYDTGASVINVGNVYNITATGDIVTSGTHHVGAGSGIPGGYYLGTNQIITGSGNATFSALTATGVLTTNITGSGFQCLHVNASGIVSGMGSGNDCGTSAGGADAALDNLASVNINTALLFQVSVDVGSAAKPLRNLYLYGSGTYSSTYFELTGTPTGTRVLTLPNVTTNMAGYQSSGWTNGHCVSIASTGELVDAGGACTVGGGGGTVSSGTIGQIAYYTGTGTVVGGATAAGDLTFSAPNFTLATVNSNIGLCGDATHVSQVTLDAKGRATACTPVAISGSFAGSVVADTSLTNTAGFYIGTTGVIQYDSGSATISIGNIYNLTAAGDIVTSGVHHVGSGTGGYYIGASQVIDGSRNGNFGTVDGSSGVFTGSVQANTSLTNTAGFYVNNTGVIQYDSGAGVVNIGNVYNITATGDIVTSSGHHVGSGSGYYVGANQIIDGSGNGTFVNLTATGTLSGLVGSVSGSGGISSSGGTTPTISCANCVLLGGLQINSSGAFVGAGVSTPSYGVNAGSYAIAGTTIIDGSRNVSTTGYLNGASLSIGGSSTINSSRQWIGAAIGDSYISSASTWNGKVSSVSGSSPISSSGGTTPAISCPTCYTTAGGAVSGNIAATGSIQANTALTNIAGFYINNTGVIQWDGGRSVIDIGNVQDITATGTIYTSGYIASAGSALGTSFVAINNSPLPGGSTYYFSGGTNSAVEVYVQVPVPHAGAFQNMFVRTNSSQPSSGNLVCTLRKNGANTALTVTVPANASAGTYSDTNTSHAVSFAQGDLWDVVTVNGASSISAGVSGLSIYFL